MRAAGRARRRRIADVVPAAVVRVGSQRLRRLAFSLRTAADAGLG
jgi:hypothetical protein